MPIQGGFANYGQAVGIIMLDTVFPRISGDVGNATTFAFPVRYKVVKGASAQRVVKDCDPTLLGPFLDAARELEGEGVKALATSCGFLAMYQRQLAGAVNIPVFSSSLLQVHLAKSVISDRRQVGIITARAQSLTEQHLAGVDAHHIPVVIAGMEDAPEFTAVFLEGKATIDVAKVELEMVLAARRLVETYPSVGAIVLECTNMPPFAKSVQDAVNLPVFDAITLVNYAYSVVVHRKF
ncbi:MAG: aspartate/glutamate racemase family protein [Rouxiella aceris]|uniref:aspartate/glutamate racemase family protein n=1 Tax=Rouxiella aceris TaxID=2703884 RepID=UPI00285008F5|nr:aspartate/glutamate racemase family protein [Rouxiella aceris]MDR3433253.1 aspartate/glutamate racemase family protein [Rouxiella aceris]